MQNRSSVKFQGEARHQNDHIGLYKEEVIKY